MNHRIEQLLEMIREDPDDAFLHYALALEYIKINDQNAADHQFSLLLQNHPDYLPAYYHAATLKVAMDDGAAASRLFEAGIALAKAKKDFKTLSELKSASGKDE